MEEDRDHPGFQCMHDTPVCHTRHRCQCSGIATPVATVAANTFLPILIPINAWRPTQSIAWSTCDTRPFTCDVAGVVTHDFYSNFSYRTIAGKHSDTTNHSTFGHPDAKAKWEPKPYNQFPIGQYQSSEIGILPGKDYRENSIAGQRNWASSRSSGPGRANDQ